MRYITVEQFKEQSEEVQKVLLDWWNPNLGDLVHSEKYGMATITQNMFSKLLDPVVMKVLKERNIPLLTLQQLWEFIEDKTNYLLEVNWMPDDTYWISTDDYWNEEDVAFYDEDKLQAFWKCACEVARVIK